MTSITNRRLVLLFAIFPIFLAIVSHVPHASRSFADDDETEEHEDEDREEHEENRETEKQNESTQRRIDTIPRQESLSAAITTERTVTAILVDSDRDGLHDADDPHPDLPEYLIVEDVDQNGIVDAFEPHPE